jgi:glucarate dehydratase
MSAFDLNGLRQRVAAVVAKGTTAARIEHALAPGTDPRKDAAKIFSALEVAFLDLQARFLGIPLFELLGGAVRREVPYSAYLFFKYAEHVGRPYEPDRWGEVLNEAQLVSETKTMIDEHGFDSIKLKAGVLEPSRKSRASRLCSARFPANRCASIPTRTGRSLRPSRWRSRSTACSSITRTRRRAWKAWRSCTGRRGCRWRPTWW